MDGLRFGKMLTKKLRFDSKMVSELEATGLSTEYYKLHLHNMITKYVLK